MYLATSSAVATNESPITAPAAVALPKSVIFGTAGIGGCLGWCVVHPFNTIAVRSNLASASGRTFSLSAMLKTNGFLSVYDGLSAGVARQVFYATTRFGLFETFRDILHEYRGKTDFASRVGVGAITGGIAGKLTYETSFDNFFLPLFPPTAAAAY
jgi:solute carrier family 25 oxoglutarate transporter 11